jgi:hypothetical protein
MVGWILLALAGLAVAVALSVTASNLSTQPIGLSGQPLRAGARLAPPVVTTPASVPKSATTPTQTATHTTTHPAPTTTTTTPTPTTTSTTPAAKPFDSDDHGGHRDHDDD